MAGAWANLLNPGLYQDLKARNLANRTAAYNLDTAQQDRATAQSVGDLLASGDRAGAANTAYGKGAIQLGMGIEGLREETIKRLGTFAGQILSLPEDQQEGAYMAGAPEMMAMMRRAGMPVPDQPEPYQTQIPHLQALAARGGALPGAAAGDFKSVKAINPATNKPFFTTEQDAVARGLSPLPSSPLVSINTKEESSFASGVGGGRATRYNKVYDEADEAAKQLETLKLQKVAVDRGLQTGALEPLRTGAAAFAESLGIPISPKRLEQVADAQSFQALTQSLLLDVLATQKGPQTKDDAERGESTLARLGNTPAANDFILRYGIAMKARIVDKANFYENYRDTVDTSGRGVERAWRRHLRDVPMFVIDENGRPLFWTEFLEQNQGKASREEIERVWKETYAE